MPKTILFIGADHAGFELKEKLKHALMSSPVGRSKPSLQIIDLSPKFVAGDDYPRHGFAVAKHVAKTKGARGILVCGSGVGVTIAANRIKGARAFDAFDERTTTLAREHNNANIIALSGWRLTASKAMKLVQAFLKTSSSKETRHLRRVKQLK